MATFWDTLAANTTSGTKNRRKKGPFLTATAAAVTTACAMSASVAAFNKTTNAFNKTTNAGGVTTMVTTAEKAVDKSGQEVPGPGGALSPETADKCLQLLADAREAYEGQGFALQADGASRFWLTF